MASEASKVTAHAVDVPKLLLTPTSQLLPLLRLLDDWKHVSARSRSRQTMQAEMRASGRACSYFPRFAGSAPRRDLEADIWRNNKYYLPLPVPRQGMQAVTLMFSVHAR